MLRYNAEDADLTRHLLISARQNLSLLTAHLKPVAVRNVALDDCLDTPVYVSLHVLSQELNFCTSITIVAVLSPYSFIV